MRETDAEIRCIVVDDHPAVLAALRTSLPENNLVVAGEATAVAAAISLVNRLSADVAIVDLQLGGGSGLDVAKVALPLGMNVVLYTAEGTATIIEQALEIGVQGFVRKDSPVNDLVRAIRAVAAGASYLDPSMTSELLKRTPSLTQRERAVLMRLSEGQQQEEIAGALGVSVPTIQKNVASAREKLAVSTTTAAVAAALRDRLIP